MDNSLIDQLIQKLGLKGENGIKEKSTELLRLLELKSSRTGSTINDYAKAIICIDLATTPLGITFDLDIGLKLSGLRKTAYANYKRTFEKILELNKPVGISEIVVQLGLHELKTKASQIFEIFRNSENTEEVDITHPQYAAMSVFQACKFAKVKSMKPKLTHYSHLKPSQWNKLEQQWDKLLEVYDNKQRKTKRHSEDENDKNNSSKITAVSSKQLKSIGEVEDYEVWKLRMLEYAQRELKRLEKQTVEAV